MEFSTGYKDMTPRQKFILALQGEQPPGRVPHFELVFFLTMEAFGRIHPDQRAYWQWDQMSQIERDLHIRDIADLYVQTARTYEHSAIFQHDPPGVKDDGDIMRISDEIRNISGMDFFLMMEGDATYAVPDGDKMMDFVVKLAEQPQEMKDEAQRRVDRRIARAEKLRSQGVVEGFAMCDDYSAVCFHNLCCNLFLC